MFISPRGCGFDLAAELFGLPSAPTRLRMVCALLEGERNVTELLQQMAVVQPGRSPPLGMLYRGGVLARDGSAGLPTGRACGGSPSAPRAEALESVRRSGAQVKKWSARHF
jgi:DNA-binding transcriptional ArsR family regulator